MSLEQGREQMIPNERGADVQVHNIWQRHAQKMSAQIFNADVSGLSTSAISPAGAAAAEQLGATWDASEHGAKGYKSNSARTEETFDALMKGYETANPGAPIREKITEREELNAWGPKEFLQLFDQKWSKNKAEKLAERGLKPEDFSGLSPDDQQVIAETAEAPVIEEWLDDPTSELAQLHPPRVAAAKFAVLFNRRHDRLAERLNSGSQIDLIHNTHRTVTEPFLVSGVLRRPDGTAVTKIADLGGPLNILDNWESVVNTDAQGKSSTTVSIRGQEFGVDEALLQQLAQEGLAAERKD